jgi:hypothetical protein
MYCFLLQGWRVCQENKQKNAGSKLSFMNACLAYSLTLKMNATDISVAAPDYVSPHLRRQ